MSDSTKTHDCVKFKQKIDLTRPSELRQWDRSCDARFEVNGKIFLCHRVVLIAASPYFEAMFNRNFKESDSDVISLKDIEADVFGEILNAIYTASISLCPSNAYIFLKASNLLLLDQVQNACISYIKNNIDSVHYLVEIYLFSKNLQQLKLLYSRCQTIIVADLINFGQTDSFTQIPLDSFREILSIWQPKTYEEEFTIQLISKWGKENKASCKDIQKLILASHLKFSKFLSPMFMARCIVPSDDTFVEIKNQISEREKMDLDVHFDLNIYLNVVDVKTGQKGWAVLKMSDKCDSYIVTKFHPTVSSYKSVCRVGSKVYCFEYFDGELERNRFSCYDENNAKICLSNPKQFLKDYKMVSRENLIYLMAVVDNRFIVWSYDCDLRIWIQSVKKNDTGKYDTVSAYTYLNGFFYVILSGSGEETLFSIDSNSYVKKPLKSWNSGYEGYMLCGFDNKLVLCNILYDSFSYIELIDLTSGGWLDGFNDDMNFRREKFCIGHHNGFIYAVESNRVIGNEKFNLETRSWEELPALPKRVTLGNANGVMKLAIGSVFGVDSETTKN